MVIKHDTLDDKNLDAVLDAMTVPEFDSDTMEKRIMAAIERGAIAAKFKPQSHQQTVHRSFWSTLGRETVGMAMMACIVLAVLIQMPNRINRLSTMDNRESTVAIDFYVTSVEQIARYETREEAILESVLSVADNRTNASEAEDTPQKSEDEIDTLLDDLEREANEPDDYWDYLMSGEQSTG